MITCMSSRILGRAQGKGGSADAEIGRIKERVRHPRGVPRPKSPQFPAAVHPDHLLLTVAATTSTPVD